MRESARERESGRERDSESEGMGGGEGDRGGGKRERARERESGREREREKERESTRKPTDTTHTFLRVLLEGGGVPQWKRTGSFIFRIIMVKIIIYINICTHTHIYI